VDNERDGSHENDVKFDENNDDGGGKL